MNRVFILYSNLKDLAFEYKHYYVKKGELDLLGDDLTKMVFFN